jgi:hypothetical protein
LLVDGRIKSQILIQIQEAQKIPGSSYGTLEKGNFNLGLGRDPHSAEGLDPVTVRPE